jgi:endo-1,4-beta-mannosidase
MSARVHDDDSTRTPDRPAVPTIQMGRRFLTRDGRSFVPVGAHYVPRSGPDWPWRTGPAEFARAFAQMADAGLTSVRIDLLWAALEPEAGRLDERHLQALDQIVASAERHGLTLHPTLFVGGEVGDAYWDIPWADGANPHADPRLRTFQAAHAAQLARRWAGHPAIIAWDLTDEPPFWIHQDTTDSEAVAWTSELVESLRSEDPTHLVTVGTASQEVDHGPFRADVVASFLDFACVHPYPIYSPELYPDSLLSRRMTHAGAFETALARGAGTEVMVHEYGASSTQFDPERIAAYDRLLTWTAFGAGAIGFYAWCWTDAEPSAYARAPYVRMPHETQFGVTTHDGRTRPRGHALTELARVLDGLDLDDRASDGPTCTAIVLVPHEYAKPYDTAAYGLTEPAGPYVPAETAWHPDRDVKPLIRGLLNCYTLASRAGLSLAFPRERLDGEWPDAQLVLAPAPLTTTTSSLLHLRTSTWSGATQLHDKGGTLYLSCSTETAIPGLENLAGVRIVDRAPIDHEVLLRFIAPFGDLAPGDEIRLPAPAPTPHLRGVLLEATDAQVLAVDQEQNPVLTIARRGAGATIVCSQPLELILADLPDAHGPDDRSWRLYAAIAQTAAAPAPARIAHPDVTNGVLTGPGGGLLVATNHSAHSVTAPVVGPTDAGKLTVLHPAGVVITDGPEPTLDMEPFSVTILTWRGSSAR